MTTPTALLTAVLATAAVPASDDADEVDPPTPTPSATETLRQGFAIH